VTPELRDEGHAQSVREGTFAPGQTVGPVDWPVLEVLGAEERRSLLRLARRRRFRKGEVVFHEGDPGDALHLVERGHLVVQRSTPLGDVATLLVLGPGDIFGELAVVAPAARNATVTALDSAETLAVHRDVFDELRARHPSVDRVLVHALAAEVRRLSALLVEALYVPADKRVYLRLLDLTRLFGDLAQGGVISIPLTQEQVGHMAGTTRPTTNRVLRAAEEAGIVRMARGRIDVLNPEAVARRAR
jgi:CRP/FNR family cyclic AMP-dependent transcriptional regulator